MILWVWPRSVSELTQDESNQIHRSGEQLYKTSLTQAPFGLLGVSFYETDNGKKRWNIRSKFAELHRKENYAFMKAVNADFYAGQTGNIVYTQSDYGRSPFDKQRVELEGNVSIRSRRGYLFEMERLNYDGVSHEFTTDEPVHMKGPEVERPSMFLKGTGLVGNIDRERFLVKKNVTARRQLKSSEWLTVASRTGEFFTEEQRALFTGKVKSQLPKLYLESDSLDLVMEESQESLAARGNVVLKRKDTMGKADSAFLEIGSSKIVLEGSARVDSKENVITGKKITLFTDEDRIEVEGAEGKVRK